MNVALEEGDAIRFATTPMEAINAVATLDIKLLQTIEPVLVSMIPEQFYNALFIKQIHFACEYIHADRDECALGISSCNQICTNTYGSYTCSCYLGYQISYNYGICVGKDT